MAKSQQRNCHNKQPSGCGKSEEKGMNYRCASCGLINECSTGAPESCSKCECTKFYKV